MSATSGRLSLMFANVAHSYSHIFMLLYPTVVLALDRVFSLSYGELIGLAFPGFVLFGVGALPAGWLGDRWSQSGMIAVFFIGTGVAAVATGFAATPWQIGLGLAAIGLFASIYHPVGTAWLVRNAVNRGKALGVNGMFGGIGVASAAFIAGALTDMASWRIAFILPGVVSVATGVAFVALIRKGLVVEASADRAPTPEPPRADRIRAIAVLAITILCGGMIFQSLSVALPKVFDLRLGTITQGTVIGAGGMVSLVYLCGSLAQVIGGHLADRYPLKLVYMTAYVALVPVLFLATLTSELPLLLAAMAMVMLNVGSLPAENSLMALYAPARWRGTAFGAKFAVSLGISALGVPLVAVVYEYSGGFAWLFIILGLFAAVVVAVAALLPGGRAVPMPQPSGGQSPAQ